jgi:hypothetical protein
VGELHPAVEDLLVWFSYAHLPPSLQSVSEPFCLLAEDLAHRTDVGGAELTVALRKLLEAKDAAVRSHLFATRGEDPA